MSGWLYLIKNGDLYKIGITKSFENRMRQLKPDYIVAKLYTNNFKQLEKEFHLRYKNVRIPQTEYFRLNKTQVREIKNRISNFYFPLTIILEVFIREFFHLLFLLLLLILFISLSVNDFNKVVYISFIWMERFAFFFSFLSLFFKSNKYLSFFNEIKFRSLRLCIYILFAFFFRFTIGFYY